MIITLLTVSIFASMFAITYSLALTIERHVEFKQVGGLKFIRIGRVSGSFCVRGR